MVDGKTSIGSNGNNDLAIINRWLRGKFKSLQDELVKGEPVDFDKVSKLQQDFAENRLGKIQTLFDDPTIRLVTVRSSFRKNNSYLRPLYSYPNELSSFIVEPENQKPFIFENIKKNPPFANLSFEKFDEEGQFSAIHILGVNSKKTGKLKNKPINFAQRIDFFWDSIRKLGEESELYKNSYGIDLNSYGIDLPVDKTRICYFTGARKENLKNKNTLELDHIFAIYMDVDSFKIDIWRNTPKIVEELLKTANDISKSLFEGLDLVAGIDAVFFKSEGLALVANLLPEFSREDIAPADKISFAIEKVTDLLNNHMIGKHNGVFGNGCNGTGNKNNKGKDRNDNNNGPKVFFLRTTFEPVKNGDENTDTYLPHLAIYPHIYREKYPEGSLLVSHASIPAATKFLLKHYIEHKNHIILSREVDRNENIETLGSLKLANSFNQLFHANKLKTNPVKNWQDLICPGPDFLDMMYHDPRDGLKGEKDKKTPFEALNKDADPDHKNKAIAAFVVEGETIRIDSISNCTIKHLPRGIFAIESSHIDAFSDADLDSLRVVFIGLASLISMLRVRSSVFRRTALA